MLKIYICMCIVFFHTYSLEKNKSFIFKNWVVCLLIIELQGFFICKSYIGHTYTWCCPSTFGCSVMFFLLPPHPVRAWWQELVHECGLPCIWILAWMSCWQHWAFRNPVKFQSFVLLPTLITTSSFATQMKHFLCPVSPCKGFLSFEFQFTKWSCDCRSLRSQFF